MSPTTTAPFTPIQAYRLDLARAPHSDGFSERDHAWLILGSVLQRAVELPASQRWAFLGQAWSTLRDAGVDPRVPAAPTVDTPAALAELTAAVCREAEERSAFAVAANLLELATLVIGRAPPRLWGRLAAQHARVLRKLGDDAAALVLYRELHEVAAQSRDVELAARADFGLGVMARIRGNYPSARQHFADVLATPPATEEIQELQAHAHHGLLIAAAAAGDFETALTHGARAYGSAGLRSDRRVELLANLAAVCDLSGHPHAALNAFLIVLAQAPSERVWLAALGGAAVAAAKLGHRAIVDRLVALGEPALAGETLPYERADLAAAFAEAFVRLRDPRAASLLARATARAGEQGFYEILNATERLAALAAAEPPPPAPAPSLSREPQAVIEWFAASDSERLAAALSDGRPEW